MQDNKNLPALSRQVTELVLAGSISHAEDAFAEAADQYGDIAVVEVLGSIAPQVTSLHLAAFDGGKLSLATLLVPPKAWAQSLGFFAATWSDDLIEMEPERLAESLFAHIHAILFANDDPERRSELLVEAAATDWGITAFAVLFSMAPNEIHEVAGEILLKGPYVTGQTSGDNDVVPLAIELAKASEDGWERALFELFPDFRHDDLNSQESGDDDVDDEHYEDDELEMTQRSTKELLYRLRKQVPVVRSSAASKPGRRKSLGTDIFS